MKRTEYLDHASAISAGGYHTCTVVGGGSVLCSGFGEYGQLGHGLTTGASTPVSVTALTDAVAIATGQNHTCALQ